MEIKVLNEELLTPHQIEVYRLTRKIEKFKKYDRERKEYYKNILFEYGQLKAFVEEIKDGNEYIKSLESQLKIMRNNFESIKGENTKLRSENIMLRTIASTDGITDEDYDILKLKKRIEDLEAVAKKQKDTINNLIYQLTQKNETV